jgi:hypothetical protein
MSHVFILLLFFFNACHYRFAATGSAALKPLSTEMFPIKANCLLVICKAKINYPDAYRDSAAFAKSGAGCPN